MSVFGEAINAIKEALKLAGAVKRIGEILKEEKAVPPSGPWNQMWHP